MTQVTLLPQLCWIGMFLLSQLVRLSVLLILIGFAQLTWTVLFVRPARHHLKRKLLSFTNCYTSIWTRCQHLPIQILVYPFRGKEIVIVDWDINISQVEQILHLYHKGRVVIHLE